jgi:metal-responsive CopG/Arc/MetJ family transcriptional regulator
MKELFERLDKAVSNEINLRADLARSDYRASVAERDARKAQEASAARAKEHELLNKVLADLERLIDAQKMEIASLQQMMEHREASYRMAENALRGDLERSRQLTETLREERDALDKRLCCIARSRWIKLGTRLRFSGLERYITSRGG